MNSLCFGVNPLKVIVPKMPLVLSGLSGLTPRVIEMEPFSILVGVKITGITVPTLKPMTSTAVGS